MRNPTRITPLLARLADAWRKAPDMRLGQLLINAHGGEDLWFPEDKELVEEVERFVKIAENGSNTTTESTGTTKIVFNAWFGGFGLRREALALYNALSGKSLTYDHNISRTDPTLVNVIEKLGDFANGTFARLRIRELPRGTKYRIDEYDGQESVVTDDEMDWETA